jgi:hypothetical protein
MDSETSTKNRDGFRSTETIKGIKIKWKIKIMGTKMKKKNIWEILIKGQSWKKKTKLL